MTFSIAAHDPKTGGFGVIVTSSSPAVAARCAHVRRGVGAVASQNITDPRLGPRILDLLEAGASAQEALDQVVAETDLIQYRQLSVVDAAGRTATFSGAHTLGTNRTATAENVAAAGNLLSDAGVPEAMVAGFQNATGAFEDRLLAGLKAGEAAGGEEGPVHSVGMVVFDDADWASTDLRVDWLDEDPLGELARVWEVWRPQKRDYVTRGLDPSTAPSYGVPGDL